MLNIYLLMYHGLGTMLNYLCLTWWSLVQLTLCFNPSQITFSLSQGWGEGICLPQWERGSGNCISERFSVNSSHFIPAEPFGGPFSDAYHRFSFPGSLSQVLYLLFSSFQIFVSVIFFFFFFFFSLCGFISLKKKSVGVWGRISPIALYLSP